MNAIPNRSVSDPAAAASELQAVLPILNQLEELLAQFQTEGLETSTDVEQLRLELEAQRELLQEIYASWQEFQREWQDSRWTFEFA